MHARTASRRDGFTFIELLIVIGIIGFLAAAILVAVDPVKRIQDARDARRYSDINAILNAILKKQVDDRVLFEATRPGAPAGEAPIITQSGSNVQVIVADASGIDCNVAAKRPGCNKPMDTAAAGKNCVVKLTDSFAATGVATTAGGPAVSGSGTAFTTELRVGDTLFSASGGTGVVATIASDTSLTLSGAPAADFSGGLTVQRANALVPNYLASIPTDPAGGTVCPTGGSCTTPGDLPVGASNSGYYLVRTAGNRIEIGACNPEQATSISVKR